MLPRIARTTAHQTYSIVHHISFARYLSNNAVKAPFHQCEDIDTWLSKQPIDSIKAQYKSQGFAMVQNIIDSKNISIYQDIYTQMLSGQIDASAHRHDLGNNEQQHLEHTENITQIMWPTEYIINLQSEGPFHQRANAIAKILLDEYNNNTTTFDFDMMLSKEPGSLTDVPWHQDCAYWPFTEDMDLNCCSFWCAIDNAYIDNGCMWFVPQTEQQLKREYKHKAAKENCHVLMIDDEEFNKELIDFDGGVAVPLKVGSCTIHHGRSPHFTKGNTMDKSRRALVACYRLSWCMNVYVNMNVCFFFFFVIYIFSSKEMVEY
eukprot:85282_1